MGSIKKSWILIGVLILFAIIIYAWVTKAYNTMVKMDEGTTASWSQVESDYQRRADLIPNLVNTVKGYAEFEQETLTGVIEARSKATSVTIDPSNLNASSIQQFQAAQDGLSQALSRLMVVVEKYPDLKANESFMGLQKQLEGTENRINVARRSFNDAVQAYNAFIRLFPKNIIANMAGFEKKEYFKAATGAEKAPEVKF